MSRLLLMLRLVRSEFLYCHVGLNIVIMALKCNNFSVSLIGECEWLAHPELPYKYS